MSESLEEWLGSVLFEKGWHLATAESCTGGLIGHRITNVAGSSNYFERGFITYSNEAKMEILGVPEDILTAHGAVSDPCARTMAEGARVAARSEIGLAVTGIAGPGGTTPEKPLGLVHVAAERVGGAALHERHVFTGSRDTVRLQAVRAALGLLKRLAGRP